MPREFSERAFPSAATAPLASAAGNASPSPTPSPIDEANRLPRPKWEWWTELGSPELNALVDSTLANNYDLRAAVARVEQAERLAMIIQGARYPSVDFFGGAEVRAPSEGVGRALTREEFRSRSTFQLGFRASYEADVWGRVGFEVESALAQARASAFNREAIALTLVAEVATTYLQILSFDERISVAENNLTIAKNIADAIFRRVEKGDSSIIELQRQQVSVALIENSLANLRLLRARLVNRLAVFAGQSPGSLKIEAVSLKGVKVPRVSAGLPSELLCRRPDIRRAEAELVAASADIKVARASLLPSVSLTAEWGQGSQKLSDLLRPESLLYSAAGNLVQSVFDSERRENQIASARARNRELLERYAGTVLAALRDVEDALAGIRLTGLQQRALSDALARNSRVLELTQRIYDRGAIDYIALLDTQRELFLAQDAEVTARFEQLRASVDLFRAIGGGTRAENDPCATPPTPGTVPTQWPSEESLAPAESSLDARVAQQGAADARARARVDAAAQRAAKLAAERAAIQASIIARARAEVEAAAQRVAQRMGTTAPLSAAARQIEEAAARAAAERARMEQEANRKLTEQTRKTPEGRR